jgi:RNA polymerase sigma-70 factor, ECF subfamily
MSQAPGLAHRPLRAAERLPDDVEAPPYELGALYRAYGEQVSRWATRLLGPMGDAEDVVQEVFLVVQRKLDGFRGEAKISTWLYGITVRTVQDRRRKLRWSRWLPLGPDDERQPHASGTPLQTLESQRAAALTYTLLDKLNDRDRTALILFELEGLTGEQIAAITGDSLSATWVRLHRARARFREAYERWEREQRGRVRPEASK